MAGDSAGVACHRDRGPRIWPVLLDQSGPKTEILINTSLVRADAVHFAD